MGLLLLEIISQRLHFRKHGNVILILLVQLVEGSLLLLISVYLLHYFLGVGLWIVFDVVIDVLNLAIYLRLLIVFSDPFLCFTIHVLDVRFVRTLGSGWKLVDFGTYC